MERIVVANHSTARVVMREAVDLRAMAEERGSGVGGGAAATTSRSEVTLGSKRTSNGVTRKFHASDRSSV